MPFNYTSGNPDNLVGGGPARMIDIQGPFYDIRAWLNSISGGGGSGALTPVLAGAAVLDVGMQGQVRAGRQLALADFTNLGLSAPLGLWNLSDLTDGSGNGRTLVNKGAVPFGNGINGFSNTAAVFAGSTGQALYIADTGVSDPFRIKTGSWGCWFRTAKRGTQQWVLTKFNAAATDRAFNLEIETPNTLSVGVAITAGTTTYATGVSDIADDRWHLGVATFDGTTLRLYVDGVLEATVAVAGTINPSAGPLNIGGYGADGGTAAVGPHYGRVDEAFVTADVLSDDQVRALYCAKIAHGASATPTRFALGVRRRRRGGTLAVADFPTQPLRLHNFTAGSLNDEGSNGVAVVNAGTAPIQVAGVDGAPGNAFSFGATGTANFMATDAGLPATTAARSYGAWFKTTTAGAIICILGWGSGAGSTSGAEIHVDTGAVKCQSGADAILGPFVADGQWHFAVAVEDNAAGDGVRRKLYLDGRCVGGSTVLNSLTLGGANRFRIGLFPDASSAFTGQVDGAFVCGYALDPMQIYALYAKGSQAMASSPKNEGDHIEWADATNVFACFDTLDSTAQIDLSVAL